MQPLTGGFFKNWKGFVGVVLALVRRGGHRQFDRRDETQSGHARDANPNVSRTSTPAILWVMLEVCIFTALLSLAMHALPG